MKMKVFSLVTGLTLVMASFGMVTPVAAAAYGTAFSSGIAYQNVGTGTAHITLDFYPAESGTPISVSRPDLAQYGSTMLFVGDLSGISSGFQGSAVMSSDQPLVSTLVQIAPDASPVKVKPMSSGFSAGAASIRIPTVLKATFSENTILAIQNVDSVGADLTVNFIPAPGSGGGTFTDPIDNLPAGASVYYDMGGTTPVTDVSWNGSVTVTAVQTGTSTAGSIVGTAMELFTSTASPSVQNNGFTFESAMASGNTLYAPSAFCNYANAVPHIGTISSAYAIQNVDAVANATVTVTFRWNDGTTDVYPLPSVIAPGAKASVNGCAPNPSMNAKIGSATITSTGAQVVAVTKVYNGGYSTGALAFLSGSARSALPYVRFTSAHWTDGQRQRVYIAIQNVDTGDIPAGQVHVSFYNADGSLLCTVNNPSLIAQYGKWSTNALDCGSGGAEFGYTPTLGGSVIVTTDSGHLVAVLGRATSYLTSTNTPTEDYSGVSY